MAALKSDYNADWSSRTNKSPFSRLKIGIHHLAGEAGTQPASLADELAGKFRSRQQRLTSLLRDAAATPLISSRAPWLLSVTESIALPPRRSRRRSDVRTP